VKIFMRFLRSQALLSTGADFSGPVDRLKDCQRETNSTEISNVSAIGRHAATAERRRMHGRPVFRVQRILSVQEKKSPGNPTFERAEYYTRNRR
jgi:hypothetical protein